MAEDTGENKNISDEQATWKEKAIYKLAKFASTPFAFLDNKINQVWDFILGKNPEQDKKIFKALDARASLDEDEGIEADLENEESQTQEDDLEEKNKEKEEVLEELSTSFKKALDPNATKLTENEQALKKKLDKDLQNTDPKDLQKQMDALSEAITENNDLSPKLKKDLEELQKLYGQAAADKIIQKQVNQTQKEINIQNDPNKAMKQLGQKDGKLTTNQQKEEQINLLKSTGDTREGAKTLQKNNNQKPKGPSRNG